MKGNEKAKAQKVIDRIQSGVFDENDVDNLFMRLRAYSDGCRVFREAADFVAHNNDRDRGLICDSMNAFYLSFKFFIEYTYVNEALDISKPIPIYIKQLMKFQVDKCQHDVLRQRFRVTPERLKARIDNLFKDDKKTKTTMLNTFKIGEETAEAIRFLLGFIGSVPAFTGNELMKDLVTVLRSNRLIFDEGSVIAQKPAIVLCVMLLMHQSRYDFGGGPVGECLVSAEHPSIPLGIPEDHIGAGFGSLQVVGLLSYQVAGKPLRVAYPVFQSDLKVSDYCDPSLFKVEAIPEAPDVFLKTITLERDLLMMAGCKLGAAETQQ